MMPRIDRSDEEEKIASLLSGVGLASPAVSALLPSSPAPTSPSPSSSPSSTLHVSTLASLVSSDQGLSTAIRTRLLPGARLLDVAIRSELVAHVLALYRYVRLQRTLSDELHIGSKTAAKRINGWLAAAYSSVDEPTNAVVTRIKTDACRVYTIFNEPVAADDGVVVTEHAKDNDRIESEEWWPNLLQSLSEGRRGSGGIGAGGTNHRPTHLLTVLRLLNQHHTAIALRYPSVPERLQLFASYLRNTQWSAPRVRQALVDDGIIDETDISSIEPRLESSGDDAEDTIRDEAEKSDLDAPAVAASAAATISPPPSKRRRQAAPVAEENDVAKDRGAFDQPAPCPLSSSSRSSPRPSSRPSRRTAATNAAAMLSGLTSSSTASSRKRKSSSSSTATALTMSDNSKANDKSKNKKQQQPPTDSSVYDAGPAINDDGEGDGDNSGETAAPANVTRDVQHKSDPSSNNRSSKRRRSPSPRDRSPVADAAVIATATATHNIDVVPPGGGGDSRSPLLDLASQCEDGPSAPMDIDAQAPSALTASAATAAAQVSVPTTETLAPTEAEADAEAADTAARAASEVAAAKDSEECMSAEEQRQLRVALKQSRDEAARTPAVTPEQRQAYEAHIQQELEATDCVLHVVPGLGDCLFASVALACEHQHIDLGEQLGDDVDPTAVHASYLRTFLASWIRTHKARLYDISGGDETWRGTSSTKRGKHRSAGGEPMTLDDCLDLLADTNERQYDIPWSSTDREAVPTNLGDYLPQLLAEALHLRIVLVQSNAPTSTIGARDPDNRLTAGTDREIMLVQSIRKNHWNVALPCARPPMVGVSPPRPASSTVSAVAAAAPADLVPASIPASTATKPNGRDDARSDDVWNITMRRRVSPDPPNDEVGSLRAQLLEAQTALEQSRNESKRLQEEHARASEAAVEAAMRTMNQIQVLVHALQYKNPDHVYRVRHGETEPDDVAHVLQQILAAQDSIPPMPGGAVSLLHLTSTMRDSWVHDVEALEAALGGPFSSDPPEPINDQDAQEALALIAEWMHQLDQWPNVESHFLEMLLLVKKLRCLNQLLTSTDDHDDDDKNLPYRVLELKAAFPRAIVHPRVWSFALRLPCCFFDAARNKMVRRSAGYYVMAAKAAAPNAQVQARLLVEQCKVLEENHLLHKAKGLKSVTIEYPEQPFAVFRELHGQYPAAGPALDRDEMDIYDNDLHVWQEELFKLEQRAAAATLDAQSSYDDNDNDTDDVERAERADAARQEAEAAREAAEEMRADPPCLFEQHMKRSQTYFHPDKRSKDRATSAEDKSAQFARLKQAWSELSAHRASFQDLRIYQARVQASCGTRAERAVLYASSARQKTG